MIASKKEPPLCGFLIRRLSISVVGQLLLIESLFYFILQHSRYLYEKTYLSYRISQQAGKLPAGSHQKAAEFFFLLLRQTAAADTDGTDGPVGEIHDNGSHTKHMIFIFFPVKGIAPLTGQSDVLQEKLQINQRIFCQGLDIHLVPLLDNFTI